MAFVSGVTDPACAAVLRRLVALFAMIHVAEGAQWTGIVGPAHAAIIDDAIAGASPAAAFIDLLTVCTGTQRRFLPCVETPCPSLTLSNFLTMC